MAILTVRNLPDEDIGRHAKLTDEEHAMFTQRDTTPAEPLDI